VYARFGLALRAFPTNRGVRYDWSPSFEEAFVVSMVAGSVTGLVVAILQPRSRPLMGLKIMNLYVEPPS
jgi:hypothetical protein